MNFHKKHLNQKSPSRMKTMMNEWKLVEGQK